MNQPSPLPAAPVEDLARHHAYLRSRLRGLGVAEASLDDAVQDVYEVLVRRIGDYDSRFSLRQWMAGVARKVARRHREQARRLPLAIDVDRLPASTVDPEHAAARQEGLAVLRRFLAGLDADRWAVFVLSEIEGLRGTEIAAELDVNLSTVYARLRTAKQAFEAAAGRQHGPGRSWLAGLLAGPTSLFRRSGSAAFTTPLALCALVATGVGLTLGTRACAGPPSEAAPERVARANVQTPAPTIRPGPGTGIAGREVDPARLVPASTEARGVPVADAEGWFNGGSGFSEGPGVWSHRLSYKLEGAELILRVEYSNDGDLPARAVGWVELDGFGIVEGPAEWPIDLAVDADRTMLWRLRATRAGVVRALFSDSPNRDGGSGGHGFAFVNQSGALRRCREHECDRRMDSVEEHMPGPRVLVELRNDCDRGIDIFEVPPNIDRPPADAIRHYLALGERRKVEIDGTMVLMNSDERGEFGGSIGTDTPGAVVRFYGKECSSRSVGDPPTPRE